MKLIRVSRALLICQRSYGELAYLGRNFGDAGHLSLQHWTFEAPRQRFWESDRTITVLEAVADSLGETVDSTDLAARFRPLPLEPRCRVCRNDALRGKINDLLATGTSYAMIPRVIEDDNSSLDKRDRITIDSIRNHTARHFPVQNVARATYRAIVERRAQENGIDFVNAVTTAITPMAFLETVMVKSYENLVDPDTKVDVRALSSW